jgi:hypothetical protein
MDGYVEAQEQQDGQKGNGTGFVVLRSAHACDDLYIVLWAANYDYFLRNAAVLLPWSMAD